MLSHNVFSYFQLRDHLAFHNKVSMEETHVHIPGRDGNRNLLLHTKTCLPERDEHGASVHRFNKALPQLIRNLIEHTNDLRGKRSMLLAKLIMLFRLIHLYPFLSVVSACAFLPRACNST